jgi:hypothetical protein
MGASAAVSVTFSKISEGEAPTLFIPLRAAAVPKADSLVNVRLDIVIPLPIEFVLVAIAFSPYSFTSYSNNTESELIKFSVFNEYTTLGGFFRTKLNRRIGLMNAFKRM